MKKMETKAQGIMATAELRALWQLLFPRVPAPDDQQLVIWQLRHSMKTIREALAELLIKYTKLEGQMAPLWMYRFASAVMTRLTQGAELPQRVSREESEPILPLSA
jgi:hypothetical protein